MFDLFFADSAWWFSVPALFGTAGYLLRLMLAAFGFEHDGGDVDLDLDHDGGATILSFQTFLAFAMGFGWGGLGGYRGAHWSASVSIGFGALCGVVFVAILLTLLSATRRLQSTGNLELKKFVGLEAETYTSVPSAGAGRGQVRAVLGDRERFLSAVSDADEIPSKARIRIVRANADNTVTVSRLS